MSKLRVNDAQMFHILLQMHTLEVNVLLIISDKK